MVGLGWCNRKYKEKSTIFEFPGSISLRKNGSTDPKYFLEFRTIS
jgi:hypothetical protein